MITPAITKDPASGPRPASSIPQSGLLYTFILYLYILSNFKILYPAKAKVILITLSWRTPLKAKRFESHDDFLLRFF